MARTQTFIHEDKIIEALRPLRGGPLSREASETSYYLMRKLVSYGYASYTDGEKTPGRGRRAKKFALTLKGAELLDSTAL